jgi:hypothetical protein
MTPFEITTSKLASGNGQLLRFALDELHVRCTHLGGSRARLRQHLRSHVDPVTGPTRRPSARPLLSKDYPWADPDRSQMASSAPGLAVLGTALGRVVGSARAFASPPAPL